MNNLQEPISKDQKKYLEEELGKVHHFLTTPLQA